jgi:pyruvate, water dikinase
MQPLVWLNELQDTHLSQVGAACLLLRQLQKEGCPIQPGFILPSPLLDFLCTKMDWQDTLLQDFLHLNLKLDVEDPASTQEIVNTIQRSLCSVPISPVWEKDWRDALQSLEHPWVILKPYLWTPTTLSTLTSPCSFAAQYCQNHPHLFLNTVQKLWAEVFSIQSILTLQAQGIRLEHIQVSILVQALPAPIMSGWLQIRPQACFIQSVLGSPESLWKGEALPEQWVSTSADHIPDHYPPEQCFAYWLTQPPKPYFPDFDQSPTPPKAIPLQQQQQWSLSPQILNRLLKYGRSLQQSISQVPLTLTWILHRSPPDKTPHLCLIHLDEDLPLPPPAPRPSPLSTHDTSNGKEPPYLLKGIGVSAGQIVAPVFVAESLQEIRPESLAQSILVTSSLDTMHLPWLRTAAGCICETGSPVSHGAILARELGCPAIMDAKGATQLFQTGQWVLLDGQSGHIYPHTATIATQPEHLESLSPPQSTKIKTKLLVTTSHPTRFLTSLPLANIDGIGLIRGEWLLLNSLIEDCVVPNLDNLTATHWQHSQNALRTLLEAVAPAPVFYRLIDFGAIQAETRHPSPFSQASGLGREPLSAARPQCRGIACHLSDNNAFRAELCMIRNLLDAGFTTMHLILPFVRSVAEVEFCQRQLQEVGLLSHPHLPLWIMAEVPSVLYLLKQYAQMGIQGIAIGLNDFTQLLLGADRNQSDFGDCVRQNQSVVMTAILQLVQQAHTLGLEIMLCGELRQYPSDFLKQLIQAGLNACTVDLGGVEPMRRAIAQAEQD